MKNTRLTRTGLVAAIRVAQDEGREWIDLHTASECVEVSREKASKTDAYIPEWAKANPVQRFATFTLTEDAYADKR